MNSKPRILISYFFAEDSIPLGFSCAHAFGELGFDVLYFHSQAEHPFQLHFLKYVSKLCKTVLFRPIDISKGTRWDNQIYREAQLEKVAQAFKPDILLIIRGNGFSQASLQKLKTDFGIKKTIGWWVKDPRKDDLQMLQDAELYDQYFCIHQYGYVNGEKIHHFPALGVDANLYRPMHARTPADLKHDVVFVGGFSPRRWQYISPILDKNLNIYGPGWLKKGRLFNFQLRKCHAARSIWGQPMVQLYNDAKIVLNVTSWDTAQLSGQNLRLFDVPSTGAFLLTDDAKEIQEYFKPGEEIETFSSPEELKSKIDYYLANDQAREKIARKGYERSQTLPSYREKMQTLLKLTGWHA